MPGADKKIRHLIKRMLDADEYRRVDILDGVEREYGRGFAETVRREVERRDADAKAKAS